eukprot:1887395-Amphidinium_carterae.1
MPWEADLRKLSSDQGGTWLLLDLSVSGQESNLTLVVDTAVSGALVLTDAAKDIAMVKDGGSRGTREVASATGSVELEVVQLEKLSLPCFHADGAQ